MFSCVKSKCNLAPRQAYTWPKNTIVSQSLIVWPVSFVISFSMLLSFFFACLLLCHFTCGASFVWVCLFFSARMSDFKHTVAGSVLSRSMLNWWSQLICCFFGGINPLRNSCLCSSVVCANHRRRHRRHCCWFLQLKRFRFCHFAKKTSIHKKEWCKFQCDPLNWMAFEIPHNCVIRAKFVFEWILTISTFSSIIIQFWACAKDQINGQKKTKDWSASSLRRSSSS